MVAYADVVTQREALAGLLQEPRIRHRHPHHRRRASRAPAASDAARAAGASSRAGSPYHAVRKPTGTFLGVIKVAPADRAGVAPAAQRLAELVDPPRRRTGGEELDHKAGHWRRMLALFSLDARARRRPAPPREELDAVPLTPEDAAELERRRAIAPDDVTALLLVGLVRSSVHIGRLAPALAVLGPPRLAGARCSAPRPTSSSTTRTSELLDSAVKGSDGFFTTFFV